jgi:hypothetical protein
MLRVSQLPMVFTVGVEAAEMAVTIYEKLKSV